jgi:hypothetical protein
MIGKKDKRRTCWFDVEVSMVENNHRLENGFDEFDDFFLLIV